MRKINLNHRGGRENNYAKKPDLTVTVIEH